MKKIFILLLAIGLFFQIKAQSRQLYSFDKKIALPGNGDYDYLAIDKTNRHLFVAHGSSVNVIDLNTEKPIGLIDNMKGVHGIAIVNEVNKGFISDGRNNAVVVFDLKTLKTIATIKISGEGPDAIMYDPYSKKVFTFNGGSNNASIIDIHSLKESGTIALNGKPEFAVADENGLIYNNLEDKNSLDVIDTKRMKVVANYPLAPCGGPTGLALDKTHQRLFTACRENKGMSVVDVKSGKIITTLPIGGGVDAVVYDADRQLIFCSNGEGNVTIIQQQTPDHYRVVQTLETQPRARTMALDLQTDKLYLSVAKFENNSRKIIPGTFEVLVYKKD